jgi:hypothetical protein
LAQEQARAGDGGTPARKVLPPGNPEIAKLAKQGYAVLGPYQVSSVSRKTISLYTGQDKPIEINLQGKRVIVKTLSGTVTGFGQIKKAPRVFVCTKGKEVQIYVLPAKEARNDKV